MDNRKSFAQMEIIAGSLLVFFLLFGFVFAWLVPILIGNPSELKEILTTLSRGNVIFLGFFISLILFGLFRIYRGVSILTGYKGKGILKSIKPLASTPEGHIDGSIEESSVLVRQEESITKSAETVKENTKRKSLTTSGVIKLLLIFTGLDFFLGIGALYERKLDSSFGIDPLSAILFLIKAGLPGIAAAGLATYLAMRQRALKRAIVSMVHRHDFIEVDTIVETTKMSARLVYESIEELKSEGVIPDDIRVTKTGGRKRNKKPSRG